MLQCKQHVIVGNWTYSKTYQQHIKTKINLLVNSRLGIPCRKDTGLTTKGSWVRIPLYTGWMWAHQKNKFLVGISQKYFSAGDTEKVMFTDNQIQKFFHDNLDSSKISWIWEKMLFLFLSFQEFHHRPLHTVPSVGLWTHKLKILSRLLNHFTTKH